MRATILASVAKTRCVVIGRGAFRASEASGSAVCRDCWPALDPVLRWNAWPCATSFGKSGEFEELLGYFNIDATAIVEAVKKVRERDGAFARINFSLSNEQPERSTL